MYIEQHNIVTRGCHVACAKKSHGDFRVSYDLNGLRSKRKFYFPLVLR